MSTFYMFIRRVDRPRPNWKLNMGPAMHPVIAIRASPLLAIAILPARSATEFPEARIVTAK